MTTTLAPRSDAADVTAATEPVAAVDPPRSSDGRRRRLLAAAVVGLQVLRKASRPRGITVCGPPSPSRNRGDEALLQAVVAQLRDTPDFEVVMTGPGPLPPFLREVPFPVHTQHYQAFNTAAAFAERLRLLAHLRTRRDLVLVGADVIDEGYGTGRSAGSLETVHFADRLGVRCRVVGFSINETPSATLAQRFRQLGAATPIVARDPLSFRRLRQGGIDNVRLGGDLAFLMPPAAEEALPDPTRRFLDRHEGRVIGLNLIGKVLGGDAGMAQWYPRFAAACALLRRDEDYGFLLLPHDDHEDIRDLRRLVPQCGERLPAEAFHLPDPVPDARALKAIAGRCRHVFTCRLHLAIATLGMGRPVTCFPYQGKFEGQFEHLRLPADGLIPPESLPTTAEGLAEVMRTRIAESETLAAAIDRRLPAVRELALRNFAGMDGFADEIDADPESDDATGGA